MAKDEHPDTAYSERPGTKTLDYIALGLLLAPPAVVFEMYIRGDPISWQRTALATAACWIAGGLTVIASKRWQSWRPKWRSLIAIENAWWGKGLIIALCMAGVLFLSSFLSSKSLNDEQIEAQKSTLVDWLVQAQREAEGEKRAAVAAEAQNATLSKSLQQAERDRDSARQERDQLQKQMQDARLRAPSGIFPPSRSPPDPQVCARLLQQLADAPQAEAKNQQQHVWLELGSSLEEEIRSVMRNLGCFAPEK
jgi:hypothetical protein